MQAGICFMPIYRFEWVNSFLRNHASIGEIGGGIDTFGKGADLSAYFQDCLEWVGGGIPLAG